MQSHFLPKPDGSKLHYLQTGNPKGPLIVRLHGLGGSTAPFAPLVSRLPPNHNIVLLDFQSFGKSPPSSQPPTISGLVSDLKHVTESLQMTRQGAEGAQDSVGI